MDRGEFLEALESIDWLESVVVGKAKRLPSILTDHGFLRAALRIANRLREAVGLKFSEPEFAHQIRANTQIDWVGATESEKSRAIGELGKLITGLPSEFLPGAKAILKKETRSVVESTKGALAKKHKELRVDPVITLRDERAIDALSSSSAIFFAPEYESRAVDFRARAQRTIAEGLRKGYGRREIAADLKAEFTDAAVSEAYFETAAANLVSRARSFSALATYAESGLERFEWIAISDSRTTPLCRDLSGRILSIKDALDGFDRLEESKDLEAVKRASPLMPSDATAEEFIAAGGFAPPAHHRCRATVSPVFD